MARDPSPREKPIPDNPVPPTPTPEPDLPPELGGRNGPEPVRYGDWEKKGIAVDF